MSSASAPPLSRRLSFPLLTRANPTASKKGSLPQLRPEGPARQKRPQVSRTRSLRDLTAENANPVFLNSEEITQYERSVSCFPMLSPGRSQRGQGSPTSSLFTSRLHGYDKDESTSRGCEQSERDSKLRESPWFENSFRAQSTLPRRESNGLDAFYSACDSPGTPSTLEAPCTPIVAKQTVWVPDVPQLHRRGPFYQTGDISGSADVGTQGWSSVRSELSSLEGDVAPSTKKGGGVAGADSKRSIFSFFRRAQLGGRWGKNCNKSFDKPRMSDRDIEVGSSDSEDWDDGPSEEVGNSGSSPVVRRLSTSKEALFSSGKPSMRPFRTLGN